MFAKSAPLNAPTLSFGQVVKKIDSHEIKKIYVKPRTNVVVYEDKEGERGQASVIANDFFIEKATSNDVDLVIATEDVTGPSLSEIITVILGLSIMASIATSIVRSNGEGQGPMGGIPGLGMNFDMIEDTGVYFEDVAGIDDARGELQEIVTFLKKPELFTQMGAKIPRGTLLYGAPGTGKTLLAKAIAGEAGVPFIATSASQFVELFVGMGAARIRSLFKRARENKPCIIFIDEIDAIGKARSGKVAVSGGNDEREQTLNQLLLEMDGFADNNGIIVVAATNRKDILDEALLRPGRFDRKITVSLPDAEGREKILAVHAKNKNLACGASLGDVAQITMGCSGADLANIMNEAAIMAARASSNVISETHLSEAVDKVLVGIRSTKKVTKKRKIMVAYHEAGHALVGMLVNGTESLRKVTIIPRGDTGGVTMFNEPEDGIVSKTYLENKIMVALGGTIAEEIGLGNEEFTNGATSDLKQVHSIARAMVSDFGMGKSKLLTDDEMQTEMKLIVDRLYKKTRSLVVGYSDKLEMLKRELVEKETLSGSECYEILKRPSLRD